MFVPCPALGVTGECSLSTRFAVALCIAPYCEIAVQEAVVPTLSHRRDRLDARRRGDVLLTDLAIAARSC